MESCNVGECKATINLDCERLMISIKKGGTDRVFFWEPGNDPKWVNLIPEEGAQPPEDNIKNCKIVWVVAGCLKEGNSSISVEMTDGMLCRADVKAFFAMYNKWRCKAEEFRLGWPWNMDRVAIEELRAEAAGIRMGDRITPMEHSVLRFIDHLVPSDDHPYYDDDLRESGNKDEKRRAMTVWRKNQIKRVGSLLNSEGPGSQR